MRKSLTCSVLILSFLFVFVLHSEAQHRSDYAGQEKREIKSLSKGDLDELRTGKGWGLAKAAELNGFPGPVHLIEIKKELKLTNEQLMQISRLYEQMKKKAIPLGLELIGLEKELDKGLAVGKINEKILDSLISKIGSIYAQLRYVHLSVHLQTPRILSRDQVKKYIRLRGYGSPDPCSRVPKGHDPELWKTHNNCK